MEATIERQRTPLHIKKGGKWLNLVEPHDNGRPITGEGKLGGKDGQGKLPCGHSGIRNFCTCPVREVQCNVCGAIFVNMKDGRIWDWFEIEDPHAKTENK